MTSCFVLLTFGARTNVVLNEFLYFWPKEVSSDQFDCFVLSHVTCYLRIVLCFQYVLLQLQIVRNPQSAFIMKGFVFERDVRARIAIHCSDELFLPCSIAVSSADHCFQQL